MAFELPEAVTVARQMQAELAGSRIARWELGRASASLVRQGFIHLPAGVLEGRRIERVGAQGKWIYVWLAPGELVLLLALETGGKFLYHAPGQPAPAKYHLRLDFDGGASFSEQIVGWGWAKIHAASELEHTRYPGIPGLSPLDEAEFSLANFTRVLQAGAKKNLKALLLEQNQVAGIGNGYLQEILFQARLHPARKAGSLSAAEGSALHAAIQSVMQAAVRLGGSALERDLYDRPGGYPRQMSQQTLGQPCPRCGTPVEKISLQSTACYICPNCQQVA